MAIGHFQQFLINYMIVTFFSAPPIDAKSLAKDCMNFSSEDPRSAARLPANRYGILTTYEDVAAALRRPTAASGRARW